MQRRILWTILLTMIAAFGLTPADLAGSWKGGMETQMGATEVAIGIPSSSSQALAGEVRLGEYEGKMDNAKLDGNKISFQVNIGPGTLTFQGTVAGDEMKLDVTGTQGNQYKLVCKRQK